MTAKGEKVGSVNGWWVFVRVAARQDQPGSGNMNA